MESVCKTNTEVKQRWRSKRSPVVPRDPKEQ